MGCGLTVQKSKPIEISNLPPWKCQSLYIFAKEANKSVIMRFDAQNEEWQILNTPNSSIKILDHSCGVMVDDDLVVVTGGLRDSPAQELTKTNNNNPSNVKEIEDDQLLDDEKTDADDACFVFSTRLNRFFSFPRLNLARFWHMMVAFKNHVYVLGGKTRESVENAIISSVEKISLAEIKEKLMALEPKKNEKYDNLALTCSWSEVEPFTKPRFKGNAFVSNENIFLIGGLTKNNKTCRYIEKYHSGNNQWSFLKWKLPFAIHSSSLTALNHNELILIGGRNDAGLVSSIYQLDISKGRYKSRRGFSLREYPKILHFNDNIYIFGGDDQKSCERFNPIEFISLSSNESYTSLLDSDLIKFPSSPPSVTIGNSSPDEPDFEELFDNHMNLAIKNQANSSEKHYLFGSPSLPFLLEFDGSYESVTYLSISINFRFYYFGAARKLNPLYLISMGGVTPPFHKASKNTQIMSLTSFSAKKCTKMLEGRMKFDAVVLNNRVIVSGGQTYVNSKDKFLKTAEEYDVLADNWKPLAPMNTARYNHCLHVYGERVYAFGGSDGENYLNSIEEYDHVANSWKICEVKLHEPLVSFTIVAVNKTDLLLLGGNNGKMNLNIAAMVNLEKNTCSVLGGIKQPRCQHKTIVYQEDVIIFGGVGTENLGIDVVRANNLNYKTEVYANLEKSIKKFYSDKTLLGIPVC